MELTVSIRNFRCFDDSGTSSITLRPGITSIVGKNNAGKSTVLKLLYELRHIFAQLRDRDSLREALRQNRSFTLVQTVKDSAAMFHDGNTQPIVLSIAYSDPAWNVAHVPQRCEITIARDQNVFMACLYDQAGAKIDYSNHWEWPNPQLFHPANPNNTLSFAYFSDAMGVLAETVYIGAYRNPVNVGTQEQYYDLAIGQAFIAKWKSLQAGPVKNQQRAIYRLTNDIKRIFELDELQVQASAENKDLVLIVNGRPYDLQEMGAGLGQFFVVLGNIAFQQPRLILIDEPELNLHPALQLDFVHTLESYASFGILFATHNVGLARAGAQYTYAVYKDAGKSVLRPYESVPRLSEFVGEMSFAGRSDLGFSKILLVESRTDIRPIQHFLRLMGKEHQVLPLPLGGETLINGHPDTEAQLRELTRVTDATNIKAIVDSERDAAGQQPIASRRDFKTLCANVGIECGILDRRSLENYFTRVAIQAALGPTHVHPGEFGKCDWHKNNNIKIARLMSLADIAGTDLSTLLTAI